MRLLPFKPSKMQLRSKILLILSFVVGGYASSNHVLQRMTVLEEFHNLERSKAQKTTVQVKAALEDELQALDGRAVDWAQADGTAEFIEGQRPEFEGVRLSAGVLDSEGLDVLYFCDLEGTAVWGKYVHPDSSQSSENHTLAELPGVGEKIADRLLMGWREEDVARGIIREQKGFLDTELGPLLISTRKVARSSGAGGSCGIVVLGRFLSNRMIEDVESKTDAVELRTWFFDAGLAPEQEREYVATSDGDPLIIEHDEGWLQVYHLIEARVEDRQLILCANVDREISAKGEDAVRSALISTIVGGLVILLVLIGLLEKAVLSPISALMKNALRISEDDTTDVKFDLAREDEIGVLSREFDNMMEKLAVSRAALVDAARQAGKAEIASGILHNVGNVLNSVNVSSAMLTKKTEELAVKDLEALNEVIAEHAENLGKFMSEDPRGKHFPPFLSALTEQFSSGKVCMQKELSSLSQGIDRIRDLVNSQQEYLTRSEVIESVDMATLIEKALVVSGNVDSFHHQLEVERDYADLPKVPLDRFKTLEILVNLIQNARQAIEEHDTDVRKLTLRLRAPNDESVRIEVEDTGVGICSGNLARVFDHGFTTKTHGHGFGLHSAANAATEMNGSLTAHSEGVGRGALLVLELPTRVTQEAGA